MVHVANTRDREVQVMGNEHTCRYPLVLWEWWGGGGAFYTRVLYNEVQLKVYVHVPEH